MAFPQGAMGLNRDDLMFPQAQAGGLKEYPFSAIISGLFVTAGTVTATAVPLNITAGSVKLDGVECRLPADLAVPALIAGTGFDQAARQTFDVYINPVRKIQSGPTLPGTGTANQIFVQTINRDDYEEIVRVVRWNGTTWVDHNLTYSKPVDQSHNNMIGTEVQAGNIVLANFSRTAEKPIYLPTKYPPYVQGPSQAWFRRSASLHLARIQVQNTQAIIERPKYSVGAA